MVAEVDEDVDVLPVVEGVGLLGRRALDEPGEEAEVGHERAGRRLSDHHSSWRETHWARRKERELASPLGVLTPGPM